LLALPHRLWRAQNLHTYAFTLQRACLSVNVHPLYVLVLSDTVAGVFDLDTGTFVDRQLGETVEALFTFVQNAIDRPAQLIRAEYDAESTRTRTAEALIPSFSIHRRHWTRDAVARRALQPPQHSLQA
jgi:hypothetical protein